MSYIIVFWVNTENLPLKNQFPILITYTVEDPDLQIKGGLGHPDPVIGGRGRAILKNLFLALRASVWYKKKIRGAGPPGPFPGSTTDI